MMSALNADIGPSRDLVQKLSRVGEGAGAWQRNPRTVLEGRARSRVCLGRTIIHSKHSFSGSVSIVYNKLGNLLLVHS
jgi:hypothetical protein